MSRKNFQKKLNKRRSKRLKERKQVLMSKRLVGKQVTQEKDLALQFGQKDVKRLVKGIGINYDLIDHSFVIE